MAATIVMLICISDLMCLPLTKLSNHIITARFWQAPHVLVRTLHHLGKEVADDGDVTDCFVQLYG